MISDNIIQNKLDNIDKKESNNSIIELFHPGTKFPSISLTGTKCELSCAHCGGYYLKRMRHFESPSRLVEHCLTLQKKNVIGVLLSGGCDQHGHVLIDNYLNAFSEIKSKTDLIINLHTGLLTTDQAKLLAKTGIDAVSLDILGDGNTISEVYGINRTPEDYIDTLLALKAAGIKKVVPHICVGLHYGEIKGEFNAIDMLSEIDIGEIVFIILIPTQATKMAKVKPPKIKSVIDIIKYAGKKCQNVKRYLGCMRPRSMEFREYNSKLEIAAIKAGINGVVLPSKNTREFLIKSKIDSIQHDRCCAI